MSIESGSVPGRLVIDGKLEFFKKVPSNKPFCHFCRQRVDLVVVFDRNGTGNPLHSCKQCVVERLAGFDIIENS